MDREEIPEQERSTGRLEPELDHIYALVLMHEQTRRGWSAAEDGNVELSRKLAALRTELLERERVERKKHHN